VIVVIIAERWVWYSVEWYLFFAGYLSYEEKVRLFMEIKTMVKKLLNKLILSSIVVLVALSLSGPLSLAKELDEIRSAIAYKKAKWTADETSISSLPDDEKKQRLGLIKAVPMGDEPILSLRAPLATLGAGFDWRQNGHVTPVKNQGNCGSCWAFAATGALESYNLIRGYGSSRTNDDRAEEILISCSTAGSCNGGSPSRAANYIRDTGLPPESYFPYTASSADDLCSNAGAGWQTSVSKAPSWSYVNTTTVSVQDIKNALVTYGPLATTMEVYYDFYSYRSGVYEYVSGAYQGAHAILIVGYRDDPSADGGGYFIVKNSWGTGWGESGFFNVAYSQTASPVYFGEWTIAYYPSITYLAAPSGLRLQSPW
jgi:C1A family cysteine protease